MNMKKKILLALRAPLICLLYYLTNSIGEYEFLLDKKGFIPLIVFYFVTIIVCFVLSSKISVTIQIIIDILFLIVLAIETVYYIYWMIRSPGEAGFGFFTIILFLPIFLFFIFFCIRDIKQYGKIESKCFETSDKEKGKEIKL